MLTAILIDDMPSAIQVLQNDLSQTDVQVIGTASSVVEAAKLLRTKTPDILFLDIMLGDGTGFDLLEILPSVKSKVIFVTASAEHAVKAFKFAAVDYLLKPYSQQDLNNAIKKAKEQIVLSKDRIDLLTETIKSPQKKPNRISLYSLEKIQVVELKDIIRCQSDNNSTLFYLVNGKRVFVTKTLKYFTDMLSDTGFIRTHQSHLINTLYIKEFIKSDGGYLILKNGKNVPVSVRKKAEVMQLLSEMG